MALVPGCEFFSHPFFLGPYFVVLKPVYFRARSKPSGKNIIKIHCITLFIFSKKLLDYKI
jgi:hypothetical protein